jgi:hypothetical protein
MGEIDRKEVATVALLALGILLFANPAYTQGQGGSAASVQVAQEIDTDGLTPRGVSQIRPDATIVPVVEYERLSTESRSIFDTGRTDVYVIRQQSDADDAVLSSGILYGDDVYLRQAQETQSGIELRYVNRSGDIGANIATPSLMSDEQRSAFVNATESGPVNLTLANRGLSAYDYVYDNDTGTYYETSTERRGNVTVFSVEATDARSVVEPAFTSTGSMDDEVRETVVAGIEGESPVVTGELLSRVQQNSLVEHEGAYYQLTFGQASPPITEAYGPLNFAGMALGIVLLAGGAYMARSVLRENT